MKRSHNWLLTLSLLSCSSVAEAQQQGDRAKPDFPRASPAGSRAVALVVGVTQFDLSGTGTTSAVSVRTEAIARRWLVLEAALTAFRPRLQDGRRPLYLVNDFQFQAQYPGVWLRPYVGVGAGSILTPDGAVVVSGAAGLRVVLWRRADVRAEMRPRATLPSFSGSTVDYMAGAAYRW